MPGPADCTIANPALLRYLFLPAEPPHDERPALEAFLEAEWARCGQLGMTESVPGLASALPRLDGASMSGFCVVAGRRGRKDIAPSRDRPRSRGRHARPGR